MEDSQAQEVVAQTDDTQVDSSVSTAVDTGTLVSSHTRLPVAHDGTKAKSAGQRGVLPPALRKLIVDSMDMVRYDEDGPFEKCIEQAAEAAQEAYIDCLKRALRSYKKPIYIFECPKITRAAYDEAVALDPTLENDIVLEIAKNEDIIGEDRLARSLKWFGATLAEKTIQTVRDHIEQDVKAIKAERLEKELEQSV